MVFEGFGSKGFVVDVEFEAVVLELDDHFLLGYGAHWMGFNFLPADTEGEGFEGDGDVLFLGKLGACLDGYFVRVKHVQWMGEDHLHLKEGDFVEEGRQFLINEPFAEWNEKFEFLELFLNPALFLRLPFMLFLTKNFV